MNALQFLIDQLFDAIINYLIQGPRMYVRISEQIKLTKTCLLMRHDG
jgi:hypothetical protein